MLKTLRGSLTALITAVTLLAGGAAHAAAVNFTAVDIDGQFDGSSFTLGWRFEVNQDLTVTSLGQLDFDEDGLESAAEIAIFDLSGTVLVSGTVADGTSSELDAFFRYTDVAPTLLEAGQQYVIASYFAGPALDVEPIFDSQFAVDPAIDLIVDRFIEVTALVFPTEEFDEPGWFGPNFRFSLVSVPEPTTALLLAASIAALGFARRRERA